MNALTVIDTQRRSVILRRGTSKYSIKASHRLDETVVLRIVTGLSGWKVFNEYNNYIDYNPVWHTF